MTHTIDSLCDELGVTKQVLHQTRKSAGLVEGEHWIRGAADRRWIVFTDAGKEALRNAVLGVGAENRPGTAGSVSGELPEPPQAQPEAEKPAPAPIVEVLVVVSSPRMFPDGSIRHFANPRVIKARRASGEEVYVRVADTRHFLPRGRDGQPMKLTARLDGEPLIWSLVGRVPRFLGRY